MGIRDWEFEKYMVKKMEYNELLTQFKKGIFAPVYLFWGEENYLLEDAVRRIITALVDPATREFNLDILYGNEVDGGTIVDLASAYPMMASRRVVVVKDVHRLSAQSLNVIVKYVERPSQTTCLVLTAPRVNFQIKSFAHLKRKAEWVQFKPLYDRQIPGWIKNYLQEINIDITEEAIQLLQENVGNSLWDLTNELEKVLLNLKGRHQIRAEDVQTVVGVSREFSVFELSRAIGRRNLTRSLEIVERMVDSGESPVGIVAMLTRHFTALLKVKSGQRKSRTPSELAQLAGVSQHFLGDYLEQAKNYSTEQLQNAFHTLLIADVNLKTSYQQPRLILELLVYQLIRS